jgi:dipeptidase E
MAFLELEMKLIALGGGGFTSDTDPYLDDFVLDLTRGNETRLGFITTASRNDPQRIERFERLMAPKVRSAQHLSAFADQHDLSNWLMTIDLLYIGGGDTEHLQSVWTERNYWPVLEDAISRGLWIAGVSAGAVIWFEAALVRNSQKMLSFIKGVGFIQGSICVHFSSEPDRKNAFLDAIQAATIPEGIAIDDGVAVVFQPDHIPYYQTARAGHQANYFYKTGIVPVRKVKG